MSRSLAILANGWSLNDHNLDRINCHVMGTNRTYKLYWPMFHVVIEPHFAKDDPEAFAKLHAQRRLLTVGGGHGKVGHNFTMRYAREPHMSNWSWDPQKEGVYIGGNGVGSVIYAALQIAYWLNYRQLLLLGLDLGGPRFDGTTPEDDHSAQDDLMLQATVALGSAGHPATVLNVGSPNSRCTAFPKMAFDKVFPLQAG